MSAAPRAAQYFGGWVATYDGAYDLRNADGHALRSRMTMVVRRVGPGPGALLDAGMGAGRLCEQLAANGWTVSGVDASIEMVEAARARLAVAPESLACAAIERLPFADESFDVVTATGVLEYSDVPAALAELRRVLRPGGRAVVSYPNPHAVYGIWKTRLWYPIIRLARRLARHPHPDMPRGAGQLPPEAFRTALGRAGLVPGRFDYTSFLALVTPLERVLPGLTVRIGERLEGRGGFVGRLVGTQIVYEARRPSAA
jgi:SAM-dependent methyltransferase